jgi:hypothetical protein
MIIKLSPAWSPVISNCNDVDEIGLTDRVMPFGNEVHITGVGDGPGVTTSVVTATVWTGVVDCCVLAPVFEEAQADK